MRDLLYPVRKGPVHTWTDKAVQFSRCNPRLITLSRCSDSSPSNDLACPEERNRDSRAREPEPIPVEWRAFLERHPGPPPEGWAFHDETSAHRVALDDGVYLMLAERDGPAFILHRVEPAGGLFHLRHFDGEPEPLAGDLELVVGSARP